MNNDSRVFISLGFVVLLVCLPAVSVSAQGSNYGQFAPDDAFEGNSKLAYYGSENEWSRRQFSQEKADDIYGRRGQRQLLAILNGEPKQALEWAEQRLAEDPQDLESPFMQTVAYCQLGQTDLALQAAQRAIEGGLPAERFLAGPRKLLEPLVSAPAFRELIANRTSGLLHGPMLGCVTASSARVWLRTEQESAALVRVYACDQRGMPTDLVVTTAAGRTTAASDFATTIEVGGLQPATAYRYDVLIDGKSVLSKAMPQLKTFPTAENSTALKVAFGGGAGYTPEHEHMWKTIAARKPDALLLLGDNVYIDLPQEPRGLHRYTYYRRQSRPEFRALVSSTPVYAVWDDHDCAMDDVWLGPYLDRPAWKPAMLQVFRENWVNSAYGSSDEPGCWFEASLGGVDFFFLDTRYFRTNPFGEHPTMLGSVQMQALRTWLKQSQSPFKVIVSSVPFAPNAKPGSHDTWDGFQEQRQEILSWLDEEKTEGVLVLSADRHRTDARKFEREGGYPIYDLMSSKLTNTHTHECVPGSLFCYNETCSFGLVTMDLEADDPTLRFEAVNLAGETVHELTIQRSELRY